MKKIILGAGLLSLFLFSTLTSAKSFSEVIPKNSNFYAEYNFLAENTIKDFFIDQITQQFSDNVFSSTELQKSILQTDAEDKQKKDIVNAYTDMLSKSKFSFNYDVLSNKFIAGGLEVNDSQYQNFINALSSKATVVSENPKIYSVPNMEYFFTKTNNLFLLAPTKEQLISLINDNDEHLNSNADYQSINSELNPNAALKIYFTNDVFTKEIEELSEDEKSVKSIFDSFKSFGIALDKTSSGISMKIITNFVVEKAKELGVNSTANNFTPTLYKYMPSANPILYGESSNLKSSINSAITMIEKFGGLSAKKIKIPAAADPYLSLLEKEIAIYVQKDEQFLPALTLLINTSKHKDTAKTLVAELGFAIEKELNKDNIIYIKSINKNLTTLSFDLSKVDKNVEIPANMNKISITMGLTPENYLLFSTYSKISAKYGEGLQNNLEFNKAFSNLNQETSGISYLNIQNLASWYDQMLNTLEQTSGNDFTKKQFQNNRDLLKKAVKPWKDLSISKKVSEKQASGEINLNFDDNALNLGYFMDISSFFTSTEKTFESFKNSRQKFTDLPEEEWYFQDVTELNSRGIIEGYNDQSFKPNNNITRAEYLALLLRSIENYKSYPYTYPTNDAIGEFSDVYKNDWYSDYIQEGVYLGIVKGFKDKTFHPNDQITRAEAVEMLNNILNKHFGNQIKLPIRAFGDPFIDVKPEDWFYDPVQRIYGYSLIDGDKNGPNFKPYRTLNRAEAAKIINKTIKAIELLPQDNFTPNLPD